MMKKSRLLTKVGRRLKNIKNFLKNSCIFSRSCYNESCAVKNGTTYGGIAQLGERLNGIQEVSGSIPLISTKKT